MGTARGNCGFLDVSTILSKDNYRVDGPARIKVMTLTPGEFIRRFLIHVLPAGFHRIRHYGLFAKSHREHNLARARQLLNMPAPLPEPSGTENIDAADRNVLPQPCPCCGGRLIVIEVFARASSPRHHSTNSPAVIKPDTS